MREGALKAPRVPLPADGVSVDLGLKRDDTRRLSFAAHGRKLRVPAPCGISVTVNIHVRACLLKGEPLS